MQHIRSFLFGVISQMENERKEKWDTERRDEVLSHIVRLQPYDG